MCGIAGYVNFSPSANHAHLESVLHQFNRMLAHRGPDATGIWLNDRKTVGFSHARLSILDLSTHAAQPMVDSTGRFVVAFNGEIYNFQEIKRLLEKEFSVNFISNSDTEVVLYGLIHLGIDRFLRLAEGMFAIAFYNSVTQKLCLIRDRVGEKPLYYYNTKDKFVFSSELKPIIGHVDNLALNIDSIYLYFLLRYVPAPFTIFTGVFKLNQGEYLVLDIETKTVEIENYYSWEPAQNEIFPTNENFEKVVDYVSREIKESIKRTMVSDVPVGFFLSGGIDSSICVAAARQMSNDNINTYSIQFEGDPASEHEVAERTAKLLGVKHKTYKLSLNDLKESSGRIIASMDEPNADRSCIPTYFLSKYSSADVKVAIGGDGGDELFGGYSRYSALATVNPQASLSGRVMEKYYSNQLKVFGASNLAKLIPVVPDAARNYLASANLYFKNDVFEAAKQIRFVDFKQYLPGAVLSKVDRMSMLNSQEVRTPFFSKKLLGIASQLPAVFLQSGGYGKPVLRRVAADLGLEHVARLEKRGFGMPNQYLFGDQEAMKSRLNKCTDFFNRSTLLAELKERNRLGSFDFKIDNANSMWATIVLAEWLMEIEQ